MQVRTQSFWSFSVPYETLHNPFSLRNPPRCVGESGVLYRLDWPYPTWYKNLIQCMIQILLLLLSSKLRVSS